MRLISWLLSLPLFAAVIVFVLQNRALVTVSFWPLDAKATLPISILSLGLLIFGVILGVFLMGFSSFRIQWEARRLRKRLATLTEHASAQQSISCQPTILYKGRYQNISNLNTPAPKSRWRRWLERK